MPYPGFEPWTFCAGADFPNHCIAWSAENCGEFSRKAHLLSELARSTKGLKLLACTFFAHVMKNIQSFIFIFIFFFSDLKDFLRTNKNNEKVEEKNIYNLIFKTKKSVTCFFFFIPSTFWKAYLLKDLHVSLICLIEKFLVLSP